MHDDTEARKSRNPFCYALFQLIESNKANLACKQKRCKLKFFEQKELKEENLLILRFEEAGQESHSFERSAFRATIGWTYIQPSFTILCRVRSAFRERFSSLS